MAITYKSIVRGMAEIDARKWVQSVLDENEIDYWYTNTLNDMTETEKEKSYSGSDAMNYRVVIGVHIGGMPTDEIRVIVGGMIDEGGIYHSAIWSENNDLLWLSNETARERLGIEKFELK